MDRCYKCGKPLHAAANQLVTTAAQHPQKKEGNMTLKEHNEIVTLKANVVDLKASLKKWQDSHHKWEAYAHSLEEKIKANQQRSTAPQYDWEPSPGDVGWRQDGAHDMPAYRAHVAEQQRIAQEVAREQEALAAMRKSTPALQWEPAPGDPGFAWNPREAA